MLLLITVEGGQRGKHRVGDTQGATNERSERPYQ